MEDWSYSGQRMTRTQIWRDMEGQEDSQDRAE